jgi:hypothetical protein
MHSATHIEFPTPQRVEVPQFVEPVVQISLKRAREETVSMVGPDVKRSRVEEQVTCVCKRERDYTCTILPDVKRQRYDSDAMDT